MSDPRFARLKTDPRFRRPRKKASKVVVDDRFKSVFAQEKTGKNGRVDKYGRSISVTHEKDNLRRFYRLGDDAEEMGLQGPPDFARGEVLLESSDEAEDDDDDDADADSSDIEKHHSGPTSPNVGASAEVDLNETDFTDLDAQATAYAEAHPDTYEEGLRTNRLAVVNLDWDHVRASHLYKICSSLVSPTAPLLPNSSKSIKAGRDQRPLSSNMVRGKIISVRVYLSDFGKERIAREEKEGPPSEIFKKKSDLDEEVNAQNIFETGGEDDYDEDALRNYQLERLRYYYAVITCDTVDSASHIYAELEGTELERSANVFDLSFVPDDMTLDNEFRDEATADSNESGFKGVDFVTDALRHSKVKLTWDEDDPERNQMTRRTLSKKEIEEADFKAYLASSSSESDDDTRLNAHGPKSTDKKSSRDALRALLLGGGDEVPEGWAPDADDPRDVDMEITFTPGLSEQKERDETTLDKYQRKIREKRKKRKEQVGGKLGHGEDSTTADAFFDTGKDDLGTSEAVPKKKPGSRSQTNSQQGGLTRSLSTGEELSLITAPDSLETEPQHFNLKAIIKSEKKQRSKRKKTIEDDSEIQKDFAIDVKDERFKSLHEDHHFAIDPSNPQFKNTKGMSALLEERSKRQKGYSSIEPGTMTEGKSLLSLVESVKRKSVTVNLPGSGKRRKL